MNSIQKTTVGFLSAAALMLAVASPALALDTSASGGAALGVSANGAGVSANADAKIQTRITNGKSRADQEIDRRVKALNDLNTRVQAMVRVSASEKAAVASTASNQVSVLTTLKTKIDADTDITVLKTDVQSITASYRIFMLVMPQGRLEVAADKLITVSGSLTTFAAKLKTHIDAASAAGKDVTAMTASYNDMNAKIADAGVQSAASVSLVASLTPDNGDKTKQANNDQALKDSRAKIKAGLQDVNTARADARAIVNALKAVSVKANASASGSVTTQ